MMKRTGTLLVLCAFLAAFGAAGCGTIEKIAPQASKKVNGVAATGNPIAGHVTLVDSSSPAMQRSTATASDGSFTFSVGGMNPPFVLRADWTDGAGAQQLYAFADDAGTTNINPLSNAIYAAAAGQGDQSSLTAFLSSSAMHAARSRHPYEKSKLLRKLAQLFEQYGIVQDPENDEYEADHRGLDGLFDDIRIRVRDGMIRVTNRRTGGLIFIAPVNDIDSGTFYPENLPGGSGGGGTVPPDGAALYGQNCSGCHGALASSSKTGRTAAQIQAAITNNTGGMGSLSGLTALEIEAIANVLAQTTTPPPPGPLDGATLYAQNCSTCHGPLATSAKLNATALQIQAAITGNIGGMGTLSGLTGPEIQRIAAALVPTAPPPAACTYTYSPWGTCQADGTQTRTMLTSSPAGCTGTPVLSQFCIYVPPVTTCTSFTYSAWGVCQSNNTQTRTVLTSLPAGCTGGTPVLSQACTYVPPVTTCNSFTYSAWGVCQSNNTQTRTVLTSSPAGCTGGSPVLSQACTYVPPVIDGAALYATSCASCHGALASTNKPGRTAAQIQTAITNNVGGMGSLSFLTAAEVQAIAAALPVAPPPAPVCGSCHSIPPATGQHVFHSTRATCATCHGTGYSTTAVNTATHSNGVRDVVASLNWNAATRTCGSPGCHGSRTW